MKQWYLEKKRRDGDGGMRGVVAVMRKLPLALHAAARGEAFDAARLFKSIVNEVNNSNMRQQVQGGDARPKRQ